MKRFILLLFTIAMLSAGGNAQELPAYFGSYDPHVGGYDLPIYDFGDVILEVNRDILVLNGFNNPYSQGRANQLILFDGRDFSVKKQVDVIQPQGDINIVAGCHSPNGGVVFTGQWFDFTANATRAFILKYDENLELEWVNLFPELDSLGVELFTYDISPTESKGYMIAQTQADYEEQHGDRRSINFMITDSLGQIVSIKNYGLDSFRNIYGYGNLSPTDDGHFVNSLYVQGGSRDYRGIIQKIDQEGNIIWSQSKSFWSGSAQIPLSSALPSGGAVMTYSVDTLITFEDEDFWLSSYISVFGFDADGQDAWQQKWIHMDNGSHSRLTRIVQAQNGDILTIAYWGGDRTPSGRRLPLSIVSRSSPDGEILWERHYQDTLNRGMRRDGVTFLGITELKDKRIAITGYAIDSSDHPLAGDGGINPNVLLMVLDSMGCLEPGCGDEVQVITSAEDWHVIGSPTVSPLLITPNPVHSEMTIRWSGKEQAALLDREQLIIYDMKGQPVYQESWDLREKRIQVSQWPSGTYTVLHLRNGIPISRGHAVVIK